MSSCELLYAQYVGLLQVQSTHCNELTDSFRGASILLVKEWTEHLLVNIAGDIAVELHVSPY